MKQLISQKYSIVVTIHLHLHKSFERLGILAVNHFDKEDDTYFDLDVLW